MVIASSIIGNRYVLIIISFLLFVLTILILIYLNRLYISRKKHKYRKKKIVVKDDSEAARLVKSGDVDFNSLNTKIRQILAKDYSLNLDFDYADLGAYFDEAELPRAEEFCRNMFDLERANENQKEQNVYLILTMLKRLLDERASYPANHRKVKIRIIWERIKSKFSSFLPKKKEDVEEESILKREEPIEKELAEEEVEEEPEIVKPTKMHPVIEKVNDLEHLSEEVERVQEVMRERKKRKR